MDIICTNCSKTIQTVSFSAFSALLTKIRCCVNPQYVGCTKQPTHFDFFIFLEKNFFVLYDKSQRVIARVLVNQGGQTKMPPRTTYGRGSRSYGQYIGQPPSATQTRVIIEWDINARAYRVSIPYDENFIQFIKAKIPGNKRDWDGTQKCWFIEDGYEQVLIVLATELWTAQSVRFVSRKDIEDAMRAQLDAQRVAVLAALPPLERSLLEFCAFLTPEALKAAYRKAAMELHPDRNPTDGEKMARLNVSWSTLEKELSQNGTK